MVDDEIREHIDKISSQMRRQYSEMLRELDLHVGQDNLLCKLWTDRRDHTDAINGTFEL